MRRLSANELVLRTGFRKRAAFIDEDYMNSERSELLRNKFAWYTLINLSRNIYDEACLSIGSYHDYLPTRKMQ